MERGIVSVALAGALLALQWIEKEPSVGILRLDDQESSMSTPPGPRRRRSLEREIIIAIIVLYLMITGVMVAVHYIQPSGQETATSSRSPAHTERSARPPAQ